MIITYQKVIDKGIKRLKVQLIKNEIEHIAKYDEFSKNMYEDKKLKLEIMMAFAKEFKEPDLEKLYYNILKRHENYGKEYN